MTKIERFFANLKEKKVAFIGTGVTNNDIIRLFLKKGISITLLDRKTPEKLGAIYEELKAAGVAFQLGDTYLDHLTDFDVVFRSPGMYYHNEKLQAARKQGVVITTEMEVFFDLWPCKIYAVTGSDGKTTTTTLISEFLQASGVTVHKGGNIGRALLPIIEQIQDTDAAVVELSSFQLLSMRQSPDVAVITNIAPNHLDVHGTMEEYIQAKTNLIAHQNAFSKTILNADNALTLNLAPMVRGMLVAFTRKTVPAYGAFLREDGMLCYQNGDTCTPVVAASDIRIPGIHNVENYLAAISAVWGEVSTDVIVQVAKTFGGVEHRIEYVTEKNGVAYYNDSKGTNPDAAIKGIQAMNRPTVLIGGGYDKDSVYTEWIESFDGKVKKLILVGETKEKIARDADACGFHDYVFADTFEEAVLLAAKTAENGDAVLLSPACASWGMFPNYEVRGEKFKEIVNSL